MPRCILLKFYIKPQPGRSSRLPNGSCILLKFYIKPQLCRPRPWPGDGCILLKFYIKPQPWSSARPNNRVVSYWNSTSNHNRARSLHHRHRLYLIEILHQTTTTRSAFVVFSSCILLKFYIKPQLRIERELARCSCILLKFYIKPQQLILLMLAIVCCILLKFYIKPQLLCRSYCCRTGCILLKFYIKPQLRQS